MFGFGLFSTHVPYLVLLIGYAACWFWNARNVDRVAVDEEDRLLAKVVDVSSTDILGTPFPGFLFVLGVVFFGNAAAW